MCCCSPALSSLNSATSWRRDALELCASRISPQSTRRLPTSLSSTDTQSESCVIASRSTESAPTKSTPPTADLWWTLPTLLSWLGALGALPAKCKRSISRRHSAPSKRPSKASIRLAPLAVSASKRVTSFCHQSESARTLAKTSAVAARLRLRSDCESDSRAPPSSSAMRRRSKSPGSAALPNETSGRATSKLLTRLCRLLQVLSTVASTFVTKARNSPMLPPDSFFSSTRISSFAKARRALSSPMRLQI
mmetsp:Transcript_86298/g.192222  ORF Transcript_86298/g.192222 Transcript_86298/m.192222 type:complete len:250 (-) Transcript_86298:28-777(-)